MMPGKLNEIENNAIESGAGWFSEFGRLTVIRVEVK